MGLIQFADDRPFAPANDDVERRLRQIDPNLGIIHLPIGRGCWALIERWGPDDPRRERIKVGELAPNKDFDVLGLAPEDIKADDAVDLLAKKLRQRVTESPAHQALLDKVIAHNKAQKAANAQPEREFAAEMLDANTGLHFRGAGFSIEGDKVVGTPHKPSQGLTKSEQDAQREA